ncbi:hypothetical protein [Saccharomonospora xinjiangensis]|uniref:hypothetical protein n=1 Tax=Saccharomonospora xinjiangensis TaxID=75294 RepID=UPI0005933664|nr:hypothetical protein [Saccharomonospora xinjiangensis]
MLAEQQGVRSIVAGGGRDVADFLQAGVGQTSSDEGESARFRHPSCRVVGLRDQAVGDGVVVQTPQGGDLMLGCAAAPAGITAGHDVGADVFGQFV